MPTMSTQKLLGSTGWAEPAGYDEASVDRAFLRSGDELVIECTYEGRRYTATLRRTAADEFSGKYETRYDGHPFEGNASCRLFTSDGAKFVFGRWYEDDQYYLWWADLKVVEHFPDES